MRFQREFFGDEFNDSGKFFRKIAATESCEAFGSFGVRARDSRGSEHIEVVGNCRLGDIQHKLVAWDWVAVGFDEGSYDF